MAYYWVEAFIQYASNFIGYVFNYPLLSVAQHSITLGNTCLYFALAGILLRFIFNTGGSLKWFQKE